MGQFLGRRFPDKQAVLDLIYMSILVVEAWALFNLLREIPALRFRETVWDMLGIIAIVQLVALVESLIVAGVLVAAAALLPSALFRRHFVGQATMILLVSAVCAIVVHYIPEPMTSWTAGQLALGVGVYLVALLVANGLLRRFARLETLVQSLAKNGALLA